MAASDRHAGFRRALSQDFRVLTKPEPDEDAAHDWSVRAEEAVRRALRNAGEPNWGDIKRFAGIYGMVIDFLERD